VLRFEDCGEAPCVLESGTIFLSKEHFIDSEEEKKKKKCNGRIEVEGWSNIQSFLDDFIKAQNSAKEEEKQRKKDEL
jgi:hypothetical protein